MANNLITVTGVITALQVTLLPGQVERLRAGVRVKTSDSNFLLAGIDLCGKSGVHLLDWFHPGDTVSATGHIEADFQGADIRFDNLSVVPADTPHCKHLSVFGYVRKADYNGCEDYNVRPDGENRRCRIWVSEQDAAKIGLKPGVMAAVEGTYEIRRCKNLLGEPVDRIYLIPETK